MSRPTTIPEVPWHDLSEAVEGYYRGLFDYQGQEAEFIAWMNEMRDGLADAAKHGADAAFVLHCLVCTCNRWLWRHSDDIEAIQRLPLRQRSQLVGAVKLLRTLGEPWLCQVLGPNASERARAFVVTISELETALSGAVVRTPGWELSSARRPKPRVEEDAITACMLWLLDELQGHPKPAHAVAALLGKAGLLKRSRGGTSAALVAKRAARKRGKAKDPLGPIGIVMRLLKTSYMDLREFLLTIPEIPDTATIWEERAAAWAVNASEYQRAFHGFCRAHGIRGHVEALARFEYQLAAVMEREDREGVAQFLGSLARDLISPQPVRRPGRPDD